MIRYLVSVGLFGVVICADPVSFINKCKPDDEKCLKESTNVAIPFFVDGIPDLGVERLDPVFFKNIDSSAPFLKLVLHNVTLKGLRNCTAKKVQRDLEKSTMFIRIQCDVTLDGHYVMSGRLLLISIEGNGKIHVDLKKAVLDLNLDISSKQGDDGKKHWTIISWTHSFDLKDKSNIRFENLFSGNKILAQAADAVIASNANVIVKDVGSPVIKIVVARVVDVIQHFFQAVPIEDLSLE